MQIYNNIDQTVVDRQQGEGKEVEEQQYIRLMQIYNNIDQTIVDRQQGEGKEVEEQEVHPVNVDL